MNKFIPILIAIHLFIGEAMASSEVEVSGTVRDELGNFVHGASISIWSYGRIVPVASTGNSGIYKFSVKPGMYYMRISADGYIPSEEFIAVVPDGPVVRDMRIRRGVVVSGVVRDKASGKPLRDAFIYENRESRWLIPVNPDGSFRITVPPKSIVYVRGRNHFEKAFEVGEEDVHLDLNLEEGSRVFGKVMDMQGKPVADARITIESKDGEKWTLYPDEMGLYSIALKPSRYSILAVAEMCDASVKTIDIRSARKETRLDFYLKAVAVKGRARDKNGKAIPFARIILSENGHEMMRIADEKGEFVVLVPFREEPGTGIKETYIISVRAPGFAESREIISPSMKTIEITLNKGGWIRGRVIEEDGTPVLDEGKILLFLSVTDALSYPLESGTFHIGPLQPGQYLIATRIKGRKHVGKVVSVSDEATTTVALVVEKTSVVEGVLRGEEGNPIGDAEISVYSEATMSTDVYYSDEKGFFSFKLPGKKGRITVEAPEYLPFKEEIEVQPGTRRKMEIVLKRGYLLSGRVIDRKRVGIEDATIELFEIDGSMRNKVKETKSGSSGFFSLTLIPGKEYELLFSAPGYIRKSEKVVAGKDGKGKIEVILEKIDIGG